MNVLSLFSGIGGLELGLERAGMTVVGQVEIDDYCRRVLAKHWPEVPRHDDVRTTVEWWQSEPRPRVDVVCGGFPCQPVSVAGRRRYQDDERWLWPAMAAVIRELRPSYAVMENVPGLLVRGMGDVLGELAAIGYDAEWDCIPAAAVGAPHLRDRWFGVAYPDGQQHEIRAHAQRWKTASDVPADPEGERRGARRPGGPVRDGQLRQGLASEELADADVGGLGRRSRIFGQAGRGQPTDSGQWATEPDVGRVAHGIPARVDRLRALGNAVVPQVAEHVGRLIMTNLGEVANR